MPRTIRTSAGLGLALMAAAGAPAAAQSGASGHVPVPAGQIEHTVTDITFPAAANTFHFTPVRRGR